MKIKNLAFFGVMASILSVAGAYADDNTIIASKAYVDAKDSALNSTLQSATAAIGTNAEANNVLSASDGTKLTKVSAIQAAKTTSVRATSSAVDTLFPTEKAVATALDNKVTKNANITASGTTNKIVQYDAKGLVVAGTTAGALATKSTIGTADVTSGSLATSENYAGTSDTKFATEKAVAKAVSDGLGTVVHPVTNGTNVLSMTASTTNAPTITAVQGMKATTIATPTSGTGAASDDKVPTELAVRTELNKKVDSTQSTKGGILTTNSSTGAVEVSTTIPNTKVSGLGSLATKSTVTSSDITDATIATADIADGAVTTAKLGADAVTNAKLADDAVQTENIKDEAVTIGKIATGAKSTSIAASGTATDDKLATEKAVRTLVDSVSSASTTGLSGKVDKDQGSSNKNKVMITDGDGKVALTDQIANTQVSGLGSLATKSTVTSSDITDGTIANADVADNAAIALTKLGTLASYSKASSASAVATGDSVQTAIGKLEKQIDGKVASNSAITASGTTKQIVTYDAKGLVTGGVAAGALATKDAVASADITDGTIVNADVSASANIDYTKMNGALKQVDNASTAATCSVASPCILTYFIDGNNKPNYKWTNMDTAGDSAVANAS